VPGSRFCAIIADDVTPFGPSDVAEATVVVVLTAALVVLVVALLAAKMVGTAMSASTATALTTIIPRRERDIPRSTLPRRCCIDE
jgi:hypothetical protein